MKETHKAYLAGLFDGDGCVSITKYNSKQSVSPVFSLQVTITQQYRYDLLWFRYFTGLGNVHRLVARSKIVEKDSPYYVWSMSGQQAESFLKLIEEYVIIKKDQVEEALRFRDTYLPLDGKKLSNEIIQRRETHRQRIKAMK